MKIYVLNLRRVRGALAFILLLCIAVASVLGVLFLVDTYLYPATISASGESVGKITTVIIDAGHGGEDCGAIGVDGSYEKDLNLAISELLCAELQSRGYNVIMTRSEDKMLYSPEENIKGMRKLSDLKNRCAIARGVENAIFISVHMNSFGSEKYSGLQVYYSEANEDSRLLAEAVQKRVRADLQTENKRTTKSGKNLYILENCPITSVIVECGFLSNAVECKKLSDKEYQKRLSLAMVWGIIDYIEAN